MCWSARIGLVAAVAAFGVTEVASAVPAACPVVPAYSGTDDVVGELRAMRADQATTCTAITDRLDLAFEKTTVLPAKLDVLHDDLVGDLGVQIRSGAGVDPGADPLRVDDVGPAPSTAQTVALDGDSRDFFTANDTVARSDLWFVVGLLCSAPFGFFFLRTVLM